MKLKSLALAIGISAFTFHAHAAADLSKETEAYKKFVIEQIDSLLADTEKFTDYLKKGDLENAKKVYAVARMYYERSEPIAESFGDLDPRIDARLADLTAEVKEAGKAKTDADAEKHATAIWTGFHKIERILWEEKTTKGTEEIADQLVKDVKELRAKISTVDVTPELMITGAVDLLNEVSTTKITGEEDIFSKTDLYDFKANIQGAEKIFELFKPTLAAKDKKLATEIETQFKAVNDLLEKHNKSKDGYQYDAYDTLTKEEIKTLAEAVNKLGEPLAQMGVIIE
ncbi:MAG: iron uptake system protein EfeO [Cardiobacteriaceae bacterium]|nr:iron uptake system protein EfeO [Cardiobacteriaceae bacterium]